MFFLEGTIFGEKQPQISLKTTSKLTKMHYVRFIVALTINRSVRTGLSTFLVKCRFKLSFSVSLTRWAS